MNDVLLDATEMKAFNDRLGALTHGRVSVGPEAINRGQARALWAAMNAFGAPARAPSSPRPSRRRSRDFSRTGALAAVSAAVALSGCTTLGGNVKGDFACRAPDGICAPTSKIDDQALAMISGGDAETVPTGVINPYDRADPQFLRTSASAAPGRSSEKVLRIVFPAHVDRLGRFREASAIHAVVERGTWMSASNARFVPFVSQMAQDRPQLASAETVPSLAELAAASPEVAYYQGASEIATSLASSPLAVQADPNAPSVAAVSAARKRGRVARTRVQTSALTTSSAPAANVQTAGLQLASSTGSPGTGSAVPRTAPTIALVPLSAVSKTVMSKTVAPTVVTLPVSGPAYDLRAAGNAGAISPVQAIREQVGAILAARTARAPDPAKPAGPATPERPANNPSVLAVSGVEPQ